VETDRAVVSVTATQAFPTFGPAMGEPFCERDRPQHREIAVTWANRGTRSQERLAYPA